MAQSIKLVDAVTSRLQHIVGAGKVSADVAARPTVPATYDALAAASTRVAAADETLIHFRAIDDALAPAQDAIEGALMSRGQRKAAGLPYRRGDRVTAQHAAAAEFEWAASIVKAGASRAGLTHRSYLADASMETWSRTPPLSTVAWKVARLGSKQGLGYPHDPHHPTNLRHALSGVTELRTELRVAQERLPAWAAYDASDAAAFHLAGRGLDEAADTETALRLAEVLDGPQFVDDVNDVVPRIFAAQVPAASASHAASTVDQIESRASTLVERLQKVRYDDSYGFAMDHHGGSGWDRALMDGPIGTPRAIRHELRELAVLARTLGDEGARFEGPLHTAEQLIQSNLHPAAFRANQEVHARTLQSAVERLVEEASRTTTRRELAMAEQIRAELPPAREVGPVDTYDALLEQQRGRLGD